MSDDLVACQYPLPPVSKKQLHYIKVVTGMDIEDYLPIIIEAAYRAVSDNKLTKIRPINVDELTGVFKKLLPPEMFKMVQETLSSFISI